MLTRVRSRSSIFPLFFLLKESAANAAFTEYIGSNPDSSRCRRGAWLRKPHPPLRFSFSGLALQMIFRRVLFPVWYAAVAPPYFLFARLRWSQNAQSLEPRPR